jgi:hypothetical protein
MLRDEDSRDAILESPYMPGVNKGVVNRSGECVSPVRVKSGRFSVLGGLNL